MKRGFTLVEVLLATVILSASLVALMSCASRCLAVMKNAKHYQMAHWTLDLGEVDHPILATNDVQKLAVDAVEYPNGYTYSRTVDDDDDKDNLYLIHIVVTRTDRPDGPREEVVRYVFERKD